MINFCYCDFPIGRIYISEENGFITNVALHEITATDNCRNRRTAVIDEAVKQLTEYFDGKRKVFDLPLNPQGTEFQRNVWTALTEIPYGKVCSYQDIAVKIGNPKAVRAVGGANNKNPILIIIPCHRVIGKDGSLVGYGGGLEIKKYLLSLEHNK